VVTTAAVVLAAGGGTRFGGDGHKLLAPLRGRPLVAWAVEAAVVAGLDEVVVVTGAVPLDEVMPPGVTLVHNPNWAQGMATSVSVGVRVAEARGHDAVVIGLGDQPLVPAEAWQAVAAADAAIAVATYDGQRGNPVRLSREVWALLPDSGDEGARGLIRSRPDLVQAVPCPGEPADVDTVEDLTRWS
jgi:CTP:molybdopterin cytidylyltransferase MocA